MNNEKTKIFSLNKIIAGFLILSIIFAIVSTIHWLDINGFIKHPEKAKEPGIFWEITEYNEGEQAKIETNRIYEGSPFYVIFGNLNSEKWYFVFFITDDYQQTELVNFENMTERICIFAGNQGRYFLVRKDGPASFCYDPMKIVIVITVIPDRACGNCT